MYEWVDEGRKEKEVDKKCERAERGSRRNEARLEWDKNKGERKYLMTALKRLQQEHQILHILQLNGKVQNPSFQQEECKATCTDNQIQ